MFDEHVEAILASITPNRSEWSAIDMLATDNPDINPEDLIQYHYREAEGMDDETALALILKSPYHVSWHTDDEGREFRLIVIDNRQAAATFKFLSRLNPTRPFDPER